MRRPGGPFTPRVRVLCILAAGSVFLNPCVMGWPVVIGQPNKKTVPAYNCQSKKLYGNLFALDLYRSNRVVNHV